MSHVKVIGAIEHGYKRQLRITSEHIGDESVVCMTWYVRRDLNGPFEYEPSHRGVTVLTPDETDSLASLLQQAAAEARKQVKP